MNTQVLRPSGQWRRRIVSAALAGLLGVGALGACSSGSESATSDSGGMAQQDMAPRPAEDGRAGSAGSAGKDVTAVAPEAARAAAGDKLVRQATLQLKVESLMEAAQRIRAIATSQKGSVLSEEMYSRPDHDDVSGTITIRVPSSSLDATLSLVEKVGEVQFRTSSTQDVTGTYVDTEARVKSLTASVQRIRDLLSRATSVGDLVALENELSRRQADLDALTAQLNSLEDSVTTSPITIALSTDDFEPVAAGGFMAGLESGWAAFTASLAVMATALGAVLPFAVTLALVGVPLALWLRRRRTPPLPVVAQTAGTPPSAR